MKYDPEHLNAYYGRADLLVQLERYEDTKVDLDNHIAWKDADLPPVVTDLIAEVESNLSVLLCSNF